MENFMCQMYVLLYFHGLPQTILIEPSVALYSVGKRSSGSGIQVWNANLHIFQEQKYENSTLITIHCCFIMHQLICVS